MTLSSRPTTLVQSSSRPSTDTPRSAVTIPAAEAVVSAVMARRSNHSDGPTLPVGGRSDRFALRGAVRFAATPARFWDVLDCIILAPSRHAIYPKARIINRDLGKGKNIERPR